MSDSPAQPVTTSITGTAGGTATGTSLRDRMRARRGELQAQTTEIFPVPRYTEVLAVELQAIEWEETEEAMRRHMRTPKRQSLLAAADEIIAATVAFHELGEDGSIGDRIDGASWLKLAKDALDKEYTRMPPPVAKRVALLDLLGSQGVVILNTSYRAWLAGANSGIGAELRGDFQGTT